jgi:hypothetical protein
MRGSRVFVRALVTLAIVTGLAVLFVKTVRDAGSAPYTIRSAHLQGWTVTLAEPGDPLGAFLTLRPPPELAMSVSQQIFRRHTDTLMAPAVRSIPLLLRSEFERAFATRVSADDLVELAEDAAIARSRFEPVCLAARSRPAGRIFFVIFDADAFTRYRHRLGVLLEARGGQPDEFDPAALSPLLMIASSDRNYEAWLPRSTEPGVDCVSPVVVE